MSIITNRSGVLQGYVPLPIYLFDQQYDLSDVDRSALMLSDSGDGEDIELLPLTTVKSNLIAGSDFITEYEGALEMAVTNRSFINVEMRFFHKFGNQPGFWASRQERLFAAANNATINIGLGVFNSRTRLPLGEFTTQDGTKIVITPQDLKSDLQIRLIARITSLARSNQARRGNTIDLITHNAKVTFHQLTPFV